MAQTTSNLPKDIDLGVKAQGPAGKDAVDEVKIMRDGKLADLTAGKWEVQCLPDDRPDSINAWGMCEVVTGSMYAYQKYFVTGDHDDDKQGNVYVRVKDDYDFWYPWRLVTTFN